MNPRKHNSTLVALAAILSVNAAAHAQVWQSLGPAPIGGFGGSAGRISSVACSKIDPDLYYVGGADGGVWKTTDGGTTWKPITDYLGVTAVGALELDPIDESIIYVGTGEANFANHSRHGVGIYKSTDAGGSWTLYANGVTEGRCISRIAINPLDTDVLYAGVTHAGGFPKLAAAKGHPMAGAQLGLIKSTDAGETWAFIASLPAISVTDVALNPTTPSTVYAAIGDIFGTPENGIYRSLDSGATWTKLTAGLPAAPGRSSLSVSPANPQNIFALFCNPSSPTGGDAGNIDGFRSTNGGDTWTVYGDVNQATYGWYLNVTSAHPTDPDMVFYGGLEMERQPGGANVTPNHVDIHAIEFDAAGRLVVGDDGGVHRSTDLGQTYVNLNTGLETAQFYAGVSTHPTNPDIVLGGLQDNGSALRPSATQAWNHVTGGDGGWTRIDQTNPLRMFTESQGTGAIYRSTNGGQSFSGVGSGLSGRNSFLPPYVIDPTNNQRMLYATHRVHVSTNGGSSFSVLSDDLTKGAGAIRALAIAPSDPNFVYVVTNDGNMQSSSNGGSLFTLRLSDVTGWPRVTRELTVHPTQPQTIYLAGATFGVPHVRRSTDAGATWQTLDGNLPDVPVSVIEVDVRATPPILYAGTDIGVFASYDDGATWRRHGFILPTANVHDLVIEPWRNRIVTSTMGRGVWTAPIALVQCEPDCDASGTLDFFDFLCFQNSFALGDPSADFDNSGTLDFFDFLAFQNEFAFGCQ